MFRAYCYTVDHAKSQQNPKTFTLFALGVPVHQSNFLCNRTPLYEFRLFNFLHFGRAEEPPTHLSTEKTNLARLQTLISGEVLLNSIGTVGAITNEGWICWQLSYCSAKVKKLEEPISSTSLQKSKSMQCIRFTAVQYSYIVLKSSLNFFHLFALGMVEQIGYPQTVEQLWQFVIVTPEFMRKLFHSAATITNN